MTENTATIADGAWGCAVVPTDEGWMWRVWCDHRERGGKTETRESAEEHVRVVLDDMQRGQL